MLRFHKQQHLSKRIDFNVTILLISSKVVFAPFSPVGDIKILNNIFQTLYFSTDIKGCNGTFSGSEGGVVHVSHHRYLRYSFLL